MKQEVNRSFDKMDVSTVISVLPVGIDDSKPGLIPTQYTIPAVRNPKTEFNFLHVYRAHFPVYLDENRPALVVPAPSDTVAESICRDYKVSMSYVEGGIAEPGLFWHKGKFDEDDIRHDLVKELAAARAKQNVWFQRLVEVADDDWNRYRIRRMISSIQRLAAHNLGLSREWSIEGEAISALAVKGCPYCKAEIHPDAIVCRFCSGVLDVAKAKAMGFVKVE